MYITRTISLINVYLQALYINMYDLGWRVAMCVCMFNVLVCVVCVNVCSPMVVACLLLFVFGGGRW